MSSRFYIIPYDPALYRDPDVLPDAAAHTDLSIKIADFIKHLRQRWGKVDLSPPYSWGIDYPQGVSGGFISDGDKIQILALEAGEGFKEFILWYRSYVPSTYPLYLFVEEGDWDSLRLTSETTLEDIASFTGL